jgi:hypothetical protein
LAAERSNQRISAVDDWCTEKHHNPKTPRQSRNLIIRPNPTATMSDDQDQALLLLDELDPEDAHMCYMCGSHKGFIVHMQTCSHSFHRSCVIPHLNMLGHCPVCVRKVIYDIVYHNSKVPSSSPSPASQAKDVKWQSMLLFMPSEAGVAVSD